jgi:hypothetical protein
MSDNPWMQHVKNFRQRNSKLSYREVLKQARKSYGGGVVGDTRSMVAKYASTVGGKPLSMNPVKPMPVHKPMPMGKPMTHKGGWRRSGTRRRRR